MFGRKRFDGQLEALRLELQGLKEAVRDQAAAIGAINSAISPFASQLHGQIPRQLAEAIAFRGDHENQLYKAFVGTTRASCSAPAPLNLGSTLCQQWHFLLDQYRFWAEAMKEKPKFLRKQWEFFFIAQSLYERGHLQGGKRGLVFGVGREPLPSLFASFGCEIVATDQSAETAAASGWIKSGQHAPDVSPLNERGICTDKMFSELVSFAPADMNDIPKGLNGQFDFVWSACSLEHLGSLEKGLRFIENSLATLKPGGMAIHTTEFNLSSNEDTIEEEQLSVYRRRDVEGLLKDLTAKGFVPAPLEWSQGEGFAETVVDLPPWGRGEPHIRLRLGDYDATSIGIIVSKPLLQAK